MSILQAANVHFDATGLMRIGKDGSNVVIKTNGASVNIEGLDVAADVAPAFDKANAALANTTTTLAGTLSITGSVNPASGVQFSTNAITNYTVSTSAPSGGSDGDVWVVIT
jgi:hypothetical protein